MWGAGLPVPHAERGVQLGVDATAGVCGVSSASAYGRAVDQSLQRPAAGAQWFSVVPRVRPK